MSFASLLARIGRAAHRSVAAERDQLRLPRRSDAILFGVITTAMLALAVVGGSVGYTQLTQGWSDPPVAQPVEDARILTNIRSHGEPFVDATLVPAEGAVYAVRRSGTVHRLNLATMLWSDETLKDLAPDLSTPVTLLQPGCGHYTAQASAACQTEGILFAVTEGGGVAMRQSGRWSVLVGDSQFKRRDGKPVAAEELRSAAMTKDGNVLLVGTATEGIGVFDVRRRTWSRLPDDIDRELIMGGQPLAITHLLADGGKVHVGTDSGLFTLDQNDGAWRIRRITGVSGRVVDLAQLRRGVVVLSREACADPADTSRPAGECAMLQKLTSAGDLTFLAGQKENLPALSDNSVMHVAEDGAEVVALGPQGIFAYVLAERRWHRRTDQPVTRVWQPAAGGVLVYAHADKIVRVDRGTTKTFDLPGVRDIVAGVGPGGVALILTEANRIYGLGPDGPRPLLDESTGSRPLASYDTAVEISGVILYLGADGALIHDPQKRTYRTIDKQAVPPMLLAVRGPLKATGKILWVAQNNRLAAFTVETSAAQPVTIEAATPAVIAMPLRSIAAGNSDTAIVVDNTGQPFQASVDNRNPQSPSVTLTPVLGNRPSRAPGDLLDAAFDAQGVIMAAGPRSQASLWTYRPADRDWTGPWHTGLGGEAFAGMAYVFGTPHVLGASGSVVQPTGHDVSVPRLLGSDRPLPFGDSELVDAMADDRIALALTASGTALIYNTEQRRIVDSFSTNATQPRIAGFVDRSPVIYDAAPDIARRADAVRGSSSLAVDGVPAIAASVRDQRILTTHRNNAGQRFIAERESGSTTCLYRQPDLSANDVFDVREIGGQLAFLTERGLRFYLPAHRRFALEQSSVGKTARLASLPNHLVIHENDQARLVPLAGPGALSLPSSCEGRTMSYTPQILRGRQIVVDEPRSRLLVLGQRGEIEESTGDRLMPLLSAPGEAPDPRALRRLAADGERIHFAATDALWTYSLTSRQWRRLALTASAPIVDVGLSYIAGASGAADAGLAVTAVDRNGNHYLGFPSNGPAIPLAIVRQQAVPAAPFDPQTLQQVLEIEPHLWLFQTGRELAVLDVRQRRWISVITLDRSVGTRLQNWQSYFVLIDGDAAAPRELAFLPRAALVGGNGQPVTLSSIASFHTPLPGERIALVDSEANNTTTYELLRYLPDGQALSCVLATPGQITDCRQTLAAALQVSAGDVTAAFDWSEHTLYFDKRGHVVLVNRRARSSLDVTRDFTRAAGGSIDPAGITVEEVGNDLWLSLPKGRLIALSADGTVRLLLDDLQEIVRKRSRQWALTKSGLRLYRSGAFLTAATTARQLFAPHKVGGISLDRDGFAVALGDDLTILREQDQGRRTAPQADTLLTATKPTPPLAQGTRPLQQGRIGQADGWWFRDAHDVFFIGREPCPPAASSAAASGAPAANCKLLSYKLPTSDAEVREITADPSPVFYLSINGVTEAFAAPTEGAPLEKVARPAPQSPQEARRAIPNNLQAFTRSITDGVLDPGTLQQSGTQVSIQYGAFTLRLRGRTAGAAVEPLRRPWLEWLVTTRQFRLFAQDGSAVEVSAGDLFGSNGFAPTLPGAVLAASLQEIVVANAHGLWTRSLTDDLVERGPRWTRFDRSLPPVVAATGGRFYFDRDSVAIEGRALEPDSSTLDVQRDSLRLSESVRQASITAQLMVDGRQVDDFAATGFLHDQRLGIGIDAGVAVVLTRVGVLRLTDFRDIRPLPGRAETSVLFAKGDELHARVDGGSVVRWTQAGWAAVDDPRRSGTLHGDANWRWERVNDEVVLSGAKWRVGRRGWRFDSDAVIGAAWGSDGIVLVTEDGTRMAQRFADLADFRPAEAPTPTTTGEGVVEARFLAPGTPVLGYADRGGFNVTWNAAQKAWHPMAQAQNPGVRRVAVAGDFLNIAFTQMRATVELAADHATKGKTLVPVTWRAQQAFPFDVARAIGTDGQRLFISTLTTLQVADTPDGPLRMIDTRPNATGPPAPIARIGRPASNPQRFVGISEASACFDLSGALPRPCTEPDTLVERSLGATDFWRWTLRDRAMVRYLDATGSVVGPTVQSIGGQGFPHDQLNAYVQCGRGLALWADSTLVTEVSGPHLAMAPRTTVPLPTGARTLHCQETVSMPGGTQQQIAPGLYALAGGVAWRMSGQQWTNVSEFAAALNERAAGLLPYERAQLRLRRVAGTQSSVASSGPLRLEYRTLANTWLPIEAEGARYAIDSRLGLLVADGKVWSVTPKGLLRLAWSGNELALDPDEVRLTILPTIGRQRCLVDRIEQSDGTGIALTMMHDKPVILRCQNGSVFASPQLGQSDDGGFQPRRDDPFVARPLIGDPTSPLQWSIVDRMAGSYGRLRLEWRGEAVPLNNGRFQADAFVGIASFEENILDLVAENGWTRTRESALSLASADRPAGSKNIAPFVRSAVRDRDSTGANVLCLRGEQTTNRQAFRDLYRADGTWEQNVSCGRFDATEGLWTYRVQPSANGISRLDIRGRDADGIEFARPFVDGRFGDLVATGAPLAGTGSGSLSFFVPTAAGLTTLLQGGGFAGPIQRPTTAGEVALLALRDGSPAIVTRSGVTSVDRKPSIECPGAPLLLDALGERARFIAMSVTREGRIEAVANREGGRVMVEGPCTGAVPAAAWLTTIELASRQRLQALGAAWKGPRAVSLAARDGRLVALRSGGLPAETPLLDQTGAPLRLLHDGSAAFLLTDSEIFRIDIDRLISVLAEHGG